MPSLFHWVGDSDQEHMSSLMELTSSGEDKHYESNKSCNFRWCWRSEEAQGGPGPGHFQALGALSPRTGGWTQLSIMVTCIRPWQHEVKTRNKGAGFHTYEPMKRNQIDLGCFHFSQK